MTLMGSIKAAAHLPRGWEVASIVLTPADAPPGATVIVQSRPGAPRTALESDLEELRKVVSDFAVLQRSNASEAMPWSECSFTQKSPLTGSREIMVHQILIMVPHDGHSLALTGTAAGPEAFGKVRAHTLELAQRLSGDG